MDTLHKLARLEREETNSIAYRRVYKAYLQNQGKIFCRLCPFHRRENTRRHAWTRNWKQFRKTQWRTQ